MILGENDGFINIIKVPPITSTESYRKGYVHQEYVLFLSKFGEFKVFIVVTPSEVGFRGKRGKILHTIITRWRSGNTGEIDARVIRELDWESICGQAKERLERSAIPPGILQKPLLVLI